MLPSCSAFGVAAVGHTNPQVVAALNRQSGLLLHGMGDVHPTRVKVELARKIAERTPGDLGGVLFGSSGGDDALNSFIQSYGLVPCEYTAHCSVPAGTPAPLWVTMFTSMFLHGGWAHILGNMVYLFVFGNHVERSMGHVRYLAFYLLCGLGANALEIATAVDSNLPGLGASGAIAGVLGGFLVLYPTSRIGTLIPLGFLVFPARIYAWVFIAFWFLLQLFNGLASLGGDAAASGGVPPGPPAARPGNHAGAAGATHRGSRQ